MLILSALVALFVVQGPITAAVPSDRCQTRACHERVAAKKVKADARWCARHIACRLRVARKREWAYYRAHPMPRCTWVGESGGNHRARNPSSTAGGKYQMLDTTFHAYGGPNYPGSHDAAQAPPLIQERIARRVLWKGWGRHRPQGLGAWVLC